MYIVLLGAPGVGKGTQGIMMSEHYGIPRFSTGEILRDAMSSGDEFGKSIQHIINRGELVPDDIVEKIIFDRLKQDDCISGFILDGFPRTIAQAFFLGSIVPDNELIIVNIEVNEKVLIKRLVSRVICKKCSTPSSKFYLAYNNDVTKCNECGGTDFYQRDDDNREAVGHRLKTYTEKTKPVVDHYKNFIRFISIDGDQAVEEVFREIMYKIDKVLVKR